MTTRLRVTFLRFLIVYDLIIIGACKVLDIYTTYLKDTYVDNPSKSGVLNGLGRSGRPAFF